MLDTRRANITLTRLYGKSKRLDMTDNRHSDKHDVLSVLTAEKGTVLTKRWCSDGTIAPADRPTYFKLKEAVVTGLDHLADVLETLAKHPDTIIIRGRYRGDAAAQAADGERYEPGLVRRSWKSFSDQPLHAVAFDVDGFPLKNVTDVTLEPEAAVREFVATLPEPWHKGGFFWKLSSSAGHPAKPGSDLRCHIWFWLSEPASSARLKAYAKSLGLAVDLKVLHPIQPFYTAAPIFDDGVDDPVEKRWGFVPGPAVDATDVLAVHVGETAIEDDDEATEQPGPKPAGEKKHPRVTLDSFDTVLRAKRFLEDWRGAVEGEHGDDHTVMTANLVMDMGLSKEKTLEVMKPWNTEQCLPPWPDEDLRTKVFSAATSRREPIGCDHPKAWFDPITDDDLDRWFPYRKRESGADDEDEDDTTRGRPKIRKLRRITAADVVLDPERNDLVDGWIDINSLVLLVGDSNTGKSFIALDLAYAVATGRPWAGLSVKKGPALYVSPEAPGSIQKRMLGVSLEHGNAGAFLQQVPEQIDLVSNGADRNAIIAAATAMAAEVGEPLKLIVLDTVARSFGGGDENGPSDMGAFVANAETIRRETGATVLLIHHPGKDREKGARGHTSLRAAVDSEITATANKARTGAIIEATKQRDRDIGAKLECIRRDVEIGRDRDGRIMKTAVLDWGEVDEETTATTDADANTRNGQIWKMIPSDGSPIAKAEIKKQIMAGDEKAGFPPIGKDGAKSALKRFVDDNEHLLIVDQMTIRRATKGGASSSVFE